MFDKTYSRITQLNIKRNYKLFYRHCGVFKKLLEFLMVCQGVRTATPSTPSAFMNIHYSSILLLSNGNRAQGNVNKKPRVDGKHQQRKLHFIVGGVVCCSQQIAVVCS